MTVRSERDSVRAAEPDRVTMMDVDFMSRNPNLEEYRDDLKPVRQVSVSGNFRTKPDQLLRGLMICCEILQKLTT